MASEPFFYDSAYQHVKRDIPIPINEDGQCVHVVAKLTTRRCMYTEKEMGVFQRV